jgi:hypothetical protein
MKSILLGALLAAFAPFSMAVTVTVPAPAANSTVASPFAVQATASSTHPITGWHVYLDSANVYSGGATTAIAASITASSGAHTLVIRAWDSTGAYGDQTITLTVSGSSVQPSPQPSPSNPLPTPPSTAKVFTNINQQTAGWGSCESGPCAGGSGEGTLWQAFNQSSPSLSGRSMEIYHDGSNSNALWYYKVGAYDSVTNYLWDFYVLLDSASQSYGQALEYDMFQFLGGYNYMIGTQCDYASGTWDTWNMATGNWLHTTIPCKKFTPNTWHHIQWYATTNHANHTYTYHTLVVDGVAFSLNQTQPAKYVAWPDNAGVQWQLDVNATGGGYHEWVDKAQLTIW